MKPDVPAFFDPATWTLTYIVKDPDSSSCAIVDSVLDYEAASGRTKTESADQVIAMIQSEGLDAEWILETHMHADHLSAAPYLHNKLGGKIGIGAHIIDVQNIFGNLFNAEIVNDEVPVLVYVFLFFRVKVIWVFKTLIRPS